MLGFKDKINAIWDEIRKPNNTQAETLYFALTKTEKEKPEAQFAYVYILKAKNEIQAALDVIEKMPLGYRQSSKPVTKKHANLLMLSKEHRQALTILENPRFKDELYFRTNRLECLRKLNETEQAVTLAKQFTEEEKQDPIAAVKLAYLHYSLREDPLPAIAIIPDYKQNIALIKPLIHLYGMAKEYEKARSVFNALLEPLKSHSEILIVYASAMVKYKGDTQNESKILTEISHILLRLLKRNLPRYLERKIVNIILRYHLEKPSFKKYISYYINKYPNDNEIILLASAKENRNQNIETLLENPINNNHLLRQYIHNAQKDNDHKTAKRIYEAILKEDLNKEQYDLWAQYASFLNENQYLQEALPLLLELIKKYPSYPPLYFCLSTYYEREHDVSAQIEILRKGNIECPSNYFIFNRLCQALIYHDDYHEAIKLYQTFVDNHPDHVDAKIQLAYAYCRIGSAGCGVKLLQEMISPQVEYEVIIGLGHCLIEAYQLERVDTFFKDYDNHPFYWTKFAELHAKSLQRQGKFQEAFKILETMHTKLGASKESYCILFQFFHGAAKQKIRFEQASLYIKNALNQFTDDAELNTKIGFYYLEIGDLVAAEICCQTTLKQNPNNTNAKALNNKIALRQKNLPFIHKNADNNLEALAHQVRDMLNNEQTTLAKITLEKLQELYPQARKTFIFFAQYYLAVGSHQKAEPYLLEIKNKYGDLTLEESITLAIIYQHTARITQSISLLTELLKVNPYHPEILLRLSDFYLYNNDLDKATELCFDIIKILPHDLRTIIQLIYIAQAQKSPLVFKYLKTAEAIRPKDLQLAFHKAYTLQEYNREEEALAALLNVYDEHSENFNLLMKIFYLYYKNNNLVEAQNFVNRLINLYPDEPDAQNAYIRLKLTKEKEIAYEEVGKIFQALQEKHPENPKVAIEYALFEKRRTGIDAAIIILNKAIKGPCKFYIKAYSELATLYISKNKLNKAKQTYQKVIKLFPSDILLNKKYLHFQLFVFKNKELSHAIKFYTAFCEKFNKHSSPLLDPMHELMYRAGLQKYIPISKIEEEVVCEDLSKLSLNDPTLELLEKIREREYKPFNIGGLPRYYYLLNELKVDFPLKLRDIDIFTNAPLDVIQDLFPAAIKNKYFSNQLYFAYKGYDVDITYVDDIRIENIGYYLKSQKGLNIDCLVMDENKIFDPTNTAKIGLQNRVLNFVGDLTSTCRDNAPLLFRMIRDLHEYRCSLSKSLPPNILKIMADSLSSEHHRKTMSEIMKMLTRGYAKDSFNTMINHQVLESINPTLNAYLEKYTTFKKWFFEQISQTDRMVKELNIKPSKPYITAAYLMSQVFERFYHSGKAYLDDAILDELFFDTFGKHTEHAQMRYYIYTFFAILQYSLDMEYQASINIETAEPDCFYSEAVEALFISEHEIPPALEVEVYEEQDKMHAQPSIEVKEEALPSGIIIAPTEMSENEDEMPLSQTPSFIEVEALPLNQEIQAGSPTLEPQNSMPQGQMPPPSNIQNTMNYLYSLLPPVPDFYSIFNTTKSYITSWQAQPTLNQTPLQPVPTPEKKKKRKNKNQYYRKYNKR